jgi:outer membrane protein TolC
MIYRPQPTLSAPRRSRRLRTAAALAISSAAACSLLLGCESAVHSDEFSHNWGNYADSVLARNIANDSLNQLPVNTSPVNKGVHEYARVDSPGPDAGPTAATDPTPEITPATAASSSPATTDASDADTIVPANAVAAEPVSTRPGDAPATRPEPSSLGQPEPYVTLSLEDAIARAMKNSLAIKVEAYNPGIKEAQVIQAQAAFDAVLFGQSQWTRQDEPETEQFSVGDETSWNNQIGIRKLFDSGGTGQITVGDNYLDINEKVNPTIPLTVNPSHTAYLNAQLSQPLLRGFGSDVNNANIFLAQKDSRIALNVFRRQVIQSVADIEEAYLSLVQTTALVDIQVRLLENTQDSYTKLEARAHIDVDQVQLSQALSAVEQRKADLIVARKNVRNSSDKLKSLINDPALDLRSNLLIVPTDKPVSEPITLDVAEQLDIALHQRSEMQEARLTIDKADIVLDVARNDLLPKADMVVSTQLTGLDNGLDQAIYGGALQADKYIDFAAGLKFEIPLGNRDAESNFRRRILERRQALTQMLQEAQQVILDVKTQLRELLTDYQEIQARSLARQSAFNELRAINTQEAVGEKLSPEFLQLKLDSQARLADAETAELQSLIDYDTAIYKLEQAKGTLLEYERVSIDAAPLQNADENKIRFLGATYGK